MVTKTYCDDCGTEIKINAARVESGLWYKAGEEAEGREIENKVHCLECSRSHGYPLGKAKN